MWDMQTGTQLYSVPLAPQSATYHDLNFSDDSSRLLAFGAISSFRTSYWQQTWDVATGKELGNSNLPINTRRDYLIPNPFFKVISPDGRLLALGAADELAAKYPDPRHIDAAGATVVPGLIDAHAHLMNLGFALLRADLVDAASKEEVIARLMSYLKELPTEMLEVLELRFYEDKDFREIAFILDITESGAKMRTYRALDSLRRNFNLRIKYDGKE